MKDKFGLGRGLGQGGGSILGGQWNVGCEQWCPCWPQRLQVGGNGDNNGEIHLENPSPCLFPRQIPVQCLVGNGIVRLEVTELC